MSNIKYTPNIKKYLSYVPEDGCLLVFCARVSSWRSVASYWNLKLSVIDIPPRYLRDVKVNRLRDLYITSKV